jgi:hypothetical protein
MAQQFYLVSELIGFVTERHCGQTIYQFDILHNANIKIINESVLL